MDKRTQTLAETSALLSLVVLTIVGMQCYVRRGLQARVKTVVDAATTVVSKVSGYENGTTTAKTIRQYEPYYREEKATIKAKQAEEESFTDYGKVRKLTLISHAHQEQASVSRQGADFKEDDIWE